MGEFFELWEDGILDEMGEYIGDGDEYPRRRKGKFNGKPNPRKGVISYIHNAYAGRSEMPKALSIAKMYAAQVGIIFESEEKMFAAISANFKDFSAWFKENRNKLINVH